MNGPHGHCQQENGKGDVECFLIGQEDSADWRCLQGHSEESPENKSLNNNDRSIDHFHIH